MGLIRLLAIILHFHPWSGFRLHSFMYLVSHIIGETYSLSVDMGHTVSQQLSRKSDDSARQIHQRKANSGKLHVCIGIWTNGGQNVIPLWPGVVIPMKWHNVIAQNSDHVEYR